MNPLAEEIVRILAMGRSKTAALARLALKAEGLVVESHPQGLSMAPAAVRQRRSRAERRGVGSDPPLPASGGVTAPVTVTLDVTDVTHGGVGGALLSSLSES